MRKYRLQKTFLPLVSLMLACSSLQAQQRSIQEEALQAAMRVADKLIRDTRFSLTLVPQKEELGMQVVDFREMIRAKDQTAYAVRSCMSTSDTSVRWGISHSGTVVIWLNGEEVYHHSQPSARTPQEKAYNRFSFGHSFSTRCKKGYNEIRIRYTSSDAKAVVFLRPQFGNGDPDQRIQFGSASPTPWMLLGALAKNDTSLCASTTLPLFHQKEGRYYHWQRQPQRMVPELVVDSTLTYTRDPYLDWNYSNGNTVWSVMKLGQLGYRNYESFVNEYTGFTLRYMDYFRTQYDSLYDFRGSFHRLFRMSMLDDAGSAVLPYVEIYRRHHDETIRRKILEPVADYILHKQVRLPDGTFCRPEPIAYTVWCDDLFMSVPFLLRWAAITGNTRYYDEAVQQFRGFRKYLQDPVSKLYQHGWFSTTQQRSPVRWGRANGWIAWATLELLEYLPASHPAYPEIREAFREQMSVLRRYQEKNGMWHQVLDRPASFEETSCTAMFTMAMAKGIRMGWIDSGYRDAALRGWQAVQRKIETDGTVHDICRGTEIGMDEAFYFERKRFDQDPRGLGAVIAAGIAIAQLDK